MRNARWPLLLAAALSSTLFAVLLFKHLSYPLFWADEAETAMMGRRILDWGYPKVHGPKGTVYSLWHRGALGIDERTDAYTGSPWAQFYVAAIGEALAARSDDLYRKTALHRLPFALAGLLGVALLAAAVLPAIEGANRKRLFCTAYALLLSYSVSLILHLREVRYYALVVLVCAGILFVLFRRHTLGTLRPGGYGISLALLLVLLFNVFYPAFTAMLAAVGLHLAFRAVSGVATWRERVARFLRDALPLLLAVAAVLPLLLFFDFLEQTRSWVERFGSLDTYLGNLRFLCTSLLRHEFLAAAIPMRVAAVALRPPRARRTPHAQQRLEIADFLTLLILVYALLISQVAFLFERYFVLLSPLVTILLLLDAFSVWAFLRAAPAPGWRLGRFAVLCSLAAFAASLWIRVPEFTGRLEEIAHPYRGPLDFVIPYLAERYPDVADRVIATNYEGGSYQYYLDSYVTVGFYAMRLERDMQMQPDVIIPRPWPEQLEELRALAERAPYEGREFPVQNLPWNNLPSLSPRPTMERAHHFRTPVPVEGGRPPLIILERRVDPETGTPPGAAPQARRSSGSTSAPRRRSESSISPWSPTTGRTRAMPKPISR